MGNELSPVERLIRQLCKLLEGTAAMARTELEERFGQDPGLERHRITRRWRRRSQTSEGDFDQAIALALARGWVQAATDGRLLITEDGARLGRRSRAGRRRVRWLE
jgi:hypothetical protein